MKSRIDWIVIYVLAFIVVLGRIGNATGSGHVLSEIIKLYPPIGPQQLGADIESLVEDLVVFLAVRHALKREVK
jgi:hypothetical protein